MLRQDLCGFASPLWENNEGKQIARTLLASIPSGDSKIIDLRQSMHDAMIGYGWSNNSWVLPTVGHPINILESNNFGPRVIYVGKSIGWLQCTPWVNPCSIEPIPDPQGGILNFEKYCSTRADLNEFLQPLFGCHLICDCNGNENHCHAHHLKWLCSQMFHDENFHLEHNAFKESFIKRIR